MPVQADLRYPAIVTALFANHRHVVVDNAGHAIPRHQPARVAELILELSS